MLSALILAAATATAPAPSAAPAAAASAVAAPASTNQAPTKQALTKQAMADKVTCKTIQETGSRVSGHKICLTRAQWAEQEGSGRELTDIWKSQARATQ